MKVLILVASYPPVLDSAARLYSQLSESLIEFGHVVTVITEHPPENFPVDNNHIYFEKKLNKCYLDGVKILRVSPLTKLSKIPLGKPIRFIISCLLFTLRGLCTKSPDIILVYSPPLYMGVAAFFISKVKRSPFIFNMQDIHPKVLLDSGIIKSRILKEILIKMEDLCYRNAKAFIVYSQGNKEHLLQHGVKNDIFIISNWVDIDELYSFEVLKSIKQTEHLGGKFLISYAGSMVRAQGLEIIVSVADKLKDVIDIVFLLAGEGSSKIDLQNLINDKKLSNILLRPVMPKNNYIQLLCESDLCLVTLNSSIPLETVPGKLADIMACGKPVLAAVNLDGDAARLINEVGCGSCVNPGDVESFSQAVLKFYYDMELRQTMGAKAREYAEKNLSRNACTKQYEKVLFSVINNFVIN